ncbi:uncharacterized protein LOC133474893, partial [Phyllopteryx taeniolatus]|uniref:uncharacterized protein LOC133474893 n=1 Tax=Phyllopteryx taeniolatus TaxID=161469 RepID=UPI002AD4CC05
MKLTLFAQLCLLILLFHSHSSSAKRRRGFFGKSFGFKKPFSSGRGSSHSSTGSKNNRGSSSQGSYPKQPSQTNQGVYNQHPGRPGSYPQQPHGSSYGGGYGSFGGSGGVYGRYPGGYINQNPNNPILNPRYGSNFGYQGKGFGGGSPFSRSVQAMNIMPNDKSRGFGRSAVMAAAGGAVAGRTLGYGLGRFPRPHFHNPQEEDYYNHYMYRKYGMKSTDTNDYDRDSRYSPPPETYDSFMDSCMKRTDVLPPANMNQNGKSGATPPPLAPGETNNTNPSNSSTSSSLSPTQPQADLVTPAIEAVKSETDNDTVSIVEIGYPALIKQVLARRCLELYMVDSEKYMMRQTSGTQEVSWSCSASTMVTEDPTEPSQDGRMGAGAHPRIARQTGHHPYQGIQEGSALPPKCPMQNQTPEGECSNPLPPPSQPPLPYATCHRRSQAPTVERDATPTRTHLQPLSRKNWRINVCLDNVLI